MDSFALDGRFADPARFAVAKQLKDGLEKGGLRQDQVHPDLVVCIGGDGSLLKALNTRGYEGRYLLINGGTLGFLGDYRINEVTRAVYDILNATPFLETHAPLVIEDNRGHKAYAANDISLIAPVRAINFEVLVDSEHLASVQGSGIVVASELGSTAFQLSLGGPVLLTGSGAYSFNLVAPLENRVAHTYFKNAVLRRESRLRVKIEQNSRLYRIATDGIEIKSIDGHEFTFYVSSIKKFTLLRYRDRSNVKRIAKSFGSL